MKPTTHSTVCLLVTVAALVGLAGAAAATGHASAADGTDDTLGPGVLGEAGDAGATWSDARSDLVNLTDAERPVVSTNEVTVSLSPANPVVPPGEQQTYDVLASGTDGGVAAYELNLTIESPAVGAFVGYESENEPLFADANISAGGSALKIITSLGDNKHEPAGTVVLGTITVEPGNVSTGSTTLSVDGARVMDNENIFYNVTGVENATLAVNADAVSIEPEPGATEQLVGSPFPAEVVVGSADDGIGAFDIQLTLDGNGSFVDYGLPRGGSDDSTIVDNGSTLSLDVALDEPYDPTDEQVVATVTVVGEAPGGLGIASTGASVSNTNGTAYVSGLGSADATLVAGPPPLPGLEERPTDVDGDLRAEDVDGDLRFDIFDVQALFNGLESNAVQSHPSAFNFNDDNNPDGVTIFDVQGLFNQLD